jgi:phosphoribosylanthranilate isomerase
MPTRVKICGITRPEDATLAAELGADFIGINLLTGPRRISGQLAQSICDLIVDRRYPPPSRRPDVVVLCQSDRVHFPDSAHWSVDFGPTLVQIYGLPNERDRSSFFLKDRWWMVTQVASRQSLSETVNELRSLSSPPAAVLLDTASTTYLGGTGKSFNWNWIAEARDAGELNGLPPIILAGGLTPYNVAEAVRIAKPYAVDVSSGVEVPGKPGIKDPIKLRDFIQAAKAAT